MGFTNLSSNCESWRPLATSGHQHCVVGVRSWCSPTSGGHTGIVSMRDPRRTCVRQIQWRQASSFSHAVRHFAHRALNGKSLPVQLAMEEDPFAYCEKLMRSLEFGFIAIGMATRLRASVQPRRDRKFADRRHVPKPCQDELTDAETLFHGSRNSPSRLFYFMNLRFEDVPNRAEGLESTSLKQRETPTNVQAITE